MIHWPQIFWLPNVGRPLNRGIPGQWMVHDLIVGFKSSQVSELKNHGKILKKIHKKDFWTEKMEHLAIF